MRLAKIIRFLILLALSALAVLCTSCVIEDEQDSSSTDDTNSSSAADRLNVEKSGYHVIVAAEDAESVLADNYTLIELSSGGASANSPDVLVEENKITISAGGSYLLRGEWQGQLLIAAGEDELVHLVLQNASIFNGAGSAIRVQQAAKVVVTLAAGTENKLNSGAAFFASGLIDAGNAALYSQSKLSINGSGRLYLSCDYGQGIYCNGQLIISEGQITIDAIGDGICSLDSVVLAGGNLTIAAAKRGICSYDRNGSDNGYIFAAGGSYQINSQQDAFCAETALFVCGGSYVLKTGVYGSDKAAWSASSHGLSAGQLLDVEQGSFRISAAENAFSSGGQMQLSGGNFNISAGSSAFAAVGDLNISGGLILVSSSMDGLSAANVGISGGIVNITASDAGLFADAPNSRIHISNGTVIVNSATNGLHSIGDILLTDGVLLVSVAEEEGSIALLSTAGAEINGGVMLLSGGRATEGISSSSGQQVLEYYLQNAQSGGTRISICNEQEQVLLSYSPQSAYDNVVFSSPQLQENASYKLYTGGKAEQGDAFGLAVEGQLEDAHPAEQMQNQDIDFSIDEVVKDENYSMDYSMLDAFSLAQ